MKRKKEDAWREETIEKGKTRVELTPKTALEKLIRQKGYEYGIQKKFTLN